MTLAELLQSLHSNPNRQMAEIAQRIDTLTVSGGQGASVDDLDAGSIDDLEIDPPMAAAQPGAYSDVALNAALDAKADQAAVASMMAMVEDRLDNLEAKLDELLASLRNSGQIAP